MAGLFKSDYELISRSLEDHVVEPIRSILIPGFDDIKSKSLEAGALGCGISGSGPSIFALSKGENTAQKVAQAMEGVYEAIDVEFDVHVSPINELGVKQVF